MSPGPSREREFNKKPVFLNRIKMQIKSVFFNVALCHETISQVSGLDSTTLVHSVCWVILSYINVRDHKTELGESFLRKFC